MFKFRSIKQLTRAGIALALAVSLGAILLPTAAIAAPLEGQYGRGGHPGCPNHYIVKAGDTLSEIAASYRVSLWALRDANHIGNIDRIYTGEYICLPGGYPSRHQSGGHQGGNQNHYPGGYRPGGH